MDALTRNAHLVERHGLGALGPRLALKFLPDELMLDPARLAQC